MRQSHVATNLTVSRALAEFIVFYILALIHDLIIFSPLLFGILELGYFFLLKLNILPEKGLQTV